MILAHQSEWAVLGRWVVPGKLVQPASKGSIGTHKQESWKEARAAQAVHPLALEPNTAAWRYPLPASTVWWRLPMSQPHGSTLLHPACQTGVGC